MSINNGINNYVSNPVQLTAVLEPDHAVLTSPATIQPSVDLTVLKEFGAIMGDDSSEIIAELIDLFLEDTPDLLNGLKQSIAQKNAGGVQSTAHTLKSTAASVGAVKISELAEHLEGIGRSGLLEHINGEVAEIFAEFELVEHFLKEEAMQALAI